MVYKLPEVVPSKNLVIEDPWGEHSIKIEKDLLLESFINEIIDKTVPYIECHRKMHNLKSNKDICILKKKQANDK